jgi:rRNA maturation RNase YbeY
LKVHFFSEDLNKKYPKFKPIWRKWIQSIIENEGFKLINVNYVFCSEDFLHQINLQYLNHDTHTDIITFDLSDDKSEIEGEIYISIPMVTENAQKFKTDFETELARVVAHGVLHLCGYLDKKKEDILVMRAKEQFYMDQLLVMLVK